APHAAPAERARMRAMNPPREHAWIFAPVVERRVHRADHAGRQRIERLRTVQFDEADAVRDMRADLVAGGNGEQIGRGHERQFSKRGRYHAWTRRHERWRTAR